MGLFDRILGRSAPDDEPNGVPGIEARQLNAEHLLVMHGRDIPAALERYRSEARHTGLVPVVLGDHDDIRLMLDTIQIVAEDEGLDTQSLYAKADAIDAEHWIEQQAETFDDINDSATVGKWPVLPRKSDGLTTHKHVLTGRYLKQVYLALFRVEHSSQVFAPVCWSAVNYDLGPEIHTAMHRRWNAQYGSEVISMTGSIVQCAVARPPQTRSEAMTLAREHYIYCPDNLWQGVGTLSELAARLLNADCWYFWWD